MSDQDRIPPYNIDTISSDENRGKYQQGDCKSIPFKILQTNIIIVWQTARRITSEILEVKGLKTHNSFLKIQPKNTLDVPLVPLVTGGLIHF